MNDTSGPHKYTEHPNFKLTLNYIRLAFRTVLLLLALYVYISTYLTTGNATLFGTYLHKPVILFVIWAVFMFEVVLRFFPSKLENMGCQKQFAGYFIPTGETIPNKQSSASVIAVALAWIALNAAVGWLFAVNVIGSDELVLISLTYSVCDVICILFFCPFQVWLMKNRCCTTCRIYNWDYAMMFTPLAFIDNFFARSLLICGIILLLRWEITAFLHPERFSDNTNRSLKCSECTEKLCRHKRKLQKLSDK